MATNPVQIPISGDSSGGITCNSHASYFQRVTITGSILNSPIKVIFSGSGEGVPMTTSTGANSFPLSPTRQGYVLNALFEFSTSGPNGPFKQAVVQDPITSKIDNKTFVSVTSEDSNDHDNNDSYLIVYYQGL